MTIEYFDPDTVTDRESFFRFAEWLISDRRLADEKEASDPQRYKWGGANDWQNSSIASFLEGALAGADAQDDWGHGSAPTWKDFAVLLRRPPDSPDTAYRLSYG